MNSAFAVHAGGLLFDDCQVSLLSCEDSLSLTSSAELDDLLVPDMFPTKNGDDLWLDNLLGDSCSEASTILAPALSDASTRLPDLSCTSQQRSVSSVASDKGLLSRSATPPQLPPLSFNLKLDYSSVANAWSEMSGGRSAIGISAAELVAVAAIIPSLQDRTASISAEAALPLASMPGNTSQSTSGGSVSADEDALARKAAFARYKEKRSARATNPSKKVRYEMRRINAEKRPRIKGRFVKKSELESYLAQQAHQQHAEQEFQLVPAF